MTKGTEKTLGDITLILKWKKTPLKAWEIAKLLEWETADVMNVLADAEDGWWEVLKFSDGGGWKYKMRCPTFKKWRIRLFDIPFH
jgi:hypothetical protein